jgi:Asp-tRNA(Asn)/Glu-tRNA(Gln) amidotransferase A subunit family amidase
MAYDPRDRQRQSFSEARNKFLTGGDNPRAYLDGFLARIFKREKTLRALTFFDSDGARQAADASATRYKAGTPLSPVDGLPLVLKDIFDIEGRPTGWGTKALTAHPARRDAAIVRALKAGGAVIIGKTTLPELGFGAPAATVNPWDGARSPGGSSSGSAAAVGAGFCPIAIGTQGKGSLTRPASFCGIYGFKPGHGTIHRGGDGGGQETNTHVGALAQTLNDAWLTARYLSEEAGPHPGHKGFEGSATLPDAIKPRCLVRLEGPGWEKTDVPARQAYDALIDAIARTGITIRAAHEMPATRALESDMRAAADALDVISDYESRWPLLMYIEREHAMPSGAYSDRVIKRGLERTKVTRSAYHDALEFRRAFRKTLRACREDGLFLISPSSTGIAPKGTDSTGSSVYQWASSLAGNPVISLPFMVVDGLPLGLELQGFVGEDENLIAAAHALDEGFTKGSF